MLYPYKTLDDDTEIVHSEMSADGKDARCPAAIQESRYLNSFSGLADSIIEGMNTPVSKCATELKW